MNDIFQIPAEISKVQSMGNRSLRLQVDTQENCTDEQMANVMSFIGKFGWFSYAIDRNIQPADIVNLPPLKTREEEEKSPAMRLRACLYVLFEQQGKQGDFEVFYRSRMDRIISMVKDKLA